MKPPSASQYVINAAQYYLDYWPSPTHTYRASQFIDALDRLLVIASPGMGASALPAPPPGWSYTGDRLSASFNLAANAWDAPDYVRQAAPGLLAWRRSYSSIFRGSR